MSDDKRQTVALAVGVALREIYPKCTVEVTATTSGCPIVRFTIAGDIYNITITRARA